MSMPVLGWTSSGFLKDMAVRLGNILMIMVHILIAVLVSRFVGLRLGWLLFLNCCVDSLIDT